MPFVVCDVGLVRMAMAASIDGLVVAESTWAGMQSAQAVASLVPLRYL